jgi:hypothetical protein
MANHNKNIDFFYYTPINNKIDFIKFKEHSNLIMSEQISDTVADLMINVEEMIINSKAFKMQANKPIVNHMKWQVYKVKKVPLTSLCLILNKITNNNLDNVIKETLEYKLYTLSDLNQLSDVFLGKCIMETKNVNNYIDYLKQVMLNKLWYVYDADNNVISFRDTIIDRLENEYVRLTKIAGQIEDVFKNQYKDDSLTNKLDGSEEYLKKKNIIVSVIKLIGSFYNGKIISTSLVEHILNKLRYSYDENINMKKIYLELWLVLWDCVSLNLKNYYIEIHKHNNEWLLNVYNKLNSSIYEEKEWDIIRLLTLIERSLGLIDVTGGKTELTFGKTELTLGKTSGQSPDVPTSTLVECKTDEQSSSISVPTKVDRKTELTFKTDEHCSSVPFPTKVEGKTDSNVNRNEITIYDIDIEEFRDILETSNVNEINNFKSKHDLIILNKYITRYVLDECIPKINNLSNVFNNSLKMIQKYLLNENNFCTLINSILDDDDIICDFPIFRKHIKEYL